MAKKKRKNKQPLSPVNSKYSGLEVLDNYEELIRLAEMSNLEQEQLYDFAEKDERISAPVDNRSQKIGYLRVSTVDQTEARQLLALSKYGINKYFCDRKSGKSMKNRPGLMSMLDYVREGDYIYILDLSRLSRDTCELLEIVRFLEAKNVTLISLKEQIYLDSSPMGKFALTMMAAIYELERGNLLERQREGIEAAKLAGKYANCGRPRVEDNIDEDLFNELYESYRDRKITQEEMAEQLGISRSSLYKILTAKGLVKKSSGRRKKKYDTKKFEELLEIYNEGKLSQTRFAKEMDMSRSTLLNIFAEKGIE